VWDYTGLGYTRYNARDVGKEYLGYVLVGEAINFLIFLFYLVSGSYLFPFMLTLFRCVVENKVLCNSLLLRLQVCLFFKPWILF
jgi:ubiquinone biosynthesis monooxygenase Coq6